MNTRQQALNWWNDLPLKEIIELKPEGKFIESLLGPEIEEIWRREREPKNEYFLFGEEACEVFDDKGIKGIIKYAKGYGGYAIYEWNKNKSATGELLEAFDGWSGYTLLTKEEHDLLAEI